MNTKNKIIAILMASVVAMAVGVPMAIGSTADTSAVVGSVDPTYSCTATVEAANEPGPGSNGQVDFQLVVTDMNGAGDISNSGWTAEWGGRTAVALLKTGETTTTKTFTGSDTIPYCTASGSKAVSFKEGTTVVCSSASFAVGSYSGLSLNFDTVSFSGDPNTQDNAGSATLSGASVAAPKIENIGNGAADVGIEASDLTTVSDTIAGSNMEGTVGTTPSWQAIGSEYTWTTSLACGSDTPTDYRLDIPAGTPTGTYTGGLTITSH